MLLPLLAVSMLHAGPPDGLPAGAIQRLGSLAFSSGESTVACFAAGGARLLTAGTDNLLREWNPRTGRLVRSFPCRAQGSVLFLAEHPRTGQVAIAGSQGH